MTRNLAIPASSGTLAGDFIIYIVCPLIVLGIPALVVWLVHSTKERTLASDALSRILRQLEPEGAPSLAEVVRGLASWRAEVQQAERDRVRGIRQPYD